VNGKLVDNPNAKWAITDTTRTTIEELVKKAFSEGMTPAELATAVEQTGVFSEARAEMIASTEMSRAQIAGALDTAEIVGAVGKESQLSGDHDNDDECNENADVGVIAIDAEFPSGDLGPPYHPRCNCALVFYTADDSEAADLV
jgi:hypothetical protein